MVWGCLICLMDRWINTQSYWLPKQLSDKDLSEVSQVQGSGMHRKIRAERNQQGYCIDIQTKTTTTPFRKCCHVDFSHLCRATQLTKGELWAAVKRHGRRRLSTTGVPTVLHLFYHATGWFVWIRNWQSSTFDILEGHQHVPPGGWHSNPNLFFRWLRWVARCVFGGDAFEGVPLPFPLPRSPPAAGTEALQLWPKSYGFIPGFQHFNEWEWQNLIIPFHSISRLTSQNVDICQKKTTHPSYDASFSYIQRPQNLKIMTNPSPFSIHFEKALSCPAPPAHLRGRQGVPLRQPVP